jgi:hypothetical protein
MREVHADNIETSCGEEIGQRFFSRLQDDVRITLSEHRNLFS